jgi:hypothetical protein
MNARASQTDRPLASSLDPDSGSFLSNLPRLRALVEGPDGAALLEELHRLVHGSGARAPRYRHKLFARVRSEGASVPEVAIVVDISASGVCLELSPSAELDALHAQRVTIETRLPGCDTVRLTATLVRVAGQGQVGTSLAFRFDEASQRDPGLHGLLERLSDDVEPPRVRAGGGSAPRTST